ncbi:MAG: hypothetical protein J6Y02_16475 [Pseudobutyrivibrio sp.]|nr:hypothetical protein [Pseudobutyrivibrio sp.]
MALITDDNGMNTTMLVSPNNGGMGGFGQDGWWIILLLLIFGMGGWNNGFGNNGGAMPFLMGNSTSNDVQRGFDQSAIINGINGINASLSNGFAQAEIAENARQLAYTNQMSNLAAQFANCCCENRLGLANLNATVLAENCSDRQALSDGVRDILTNQNANTQRILDQMCNDKIDSKNEKIAELQQQLTMANLAQSQTAQTAQILADNQRQTVALEQYLNPTPVPAYVVSNPNCCQPTSCGCGF